MTNIEKEYLTSCPICNKSKILHLEEIPCTKLTFGDFAVYQCETCEIVFTNPSIKEESIPNLYLERDQGMDISRNRGIFSKLRHLKLRKYVYNIDKAINKGNYTVLDLGCGDGLLGEVFARKNNVVSVVCADFAPNSPFIGNDKLSYISLSKEMIQQKFDLIIMRHVLEHTHNPYMHILDIKKLLNDDGVIVLEVPNFNSIWRKYFGHNYNQLGIPHHLFHFTKSSMRKMFEDKFDVEITDANVPVLGPSFVKVFSKDTNNNIGLMATLFYPFQLLVDCFCKDKTAMLVFLRVKK